MTMTTQYLTFPRTDPTKPYMSIAELDMVAHFTHCQYKKNMTSKGPCKLSNRLNLRGNRLGLNLHFAELDSFLEVGGMRSIHSAKDGCHEMSFPTSS